MSEPVVDRSELGRFGLGRVDVVERFGDVEVADPYRQLERETREVQAWAAHQHARAGEALAQLPGLDALAAELTEHLLADRLLAPSRAGDGWLWRERDAAGHTRALRRSARLEDGPGERLLAASAIAVDGDEAIDWFAPSPDGRLLALGVSSHGDEQPVLALVELATGAPVGPSIPHVGGVAWLPDGSGLYLARGRARSQEQGLKRLAFLVPGERPTWVDGPPLAADGNVLVQVSPDGRRVGLAASFMHPRLLYVHDRHAGTWLEAFPAADDHVFAGTFGADGDTYYAVTDVGGERTRLVAAPLRALADLAGWRELVPGDEAVLRSVARFGEDLLLGELLDGVPRLRVVSTDGEERAVLPLAREHVISSFDRFRSEAMPTLPVQADGRRLVFTASTVERATALWRWDVDGATAEQLTAPARTLPPLRVETLTCRAPDGHEVRYDLIRRADVAAGDAPLPTLLHGYGGFNSAALPLGYPSFFAPWITAGGAFAFAHLRGDGTFGTERWRDGRRERKQHSFDDLLACAEALLARGLTTREQLAVCGASNGGLLVGAAITQRPELFAAAAVLIPMSDMLRLGRERYSEMFIGEYGDPLAAGEAAWLHAYSPYHRVRAGTPYPATIVVAGDRDMRTHAWHARKLAAALRDAADPATPILLRTHLDHGHNTAAGSEPALIAEWLGFLMAQVGLLPAGAGAGTAAARG